MRDMQKRFAHGPKATKNKRTNISVLKRPIQFGNLVNRIEGYFELSPTTPLRQSWRVRVWRCSGEISKIFYSTSKWDGHARMGCLSEIVPNSNKIFLIFIIYFKYVSRQWEEVFGPDGNNSVSNAIQKSIMHTFTTNSDFFLSVVSYLVGKRTTGPPGNLWEFTRKPLSFWMCPWSPRLFLSGFQGHLWCFSNVTEQKKIQIKKQKKSIFSTQTSRRLDATQSGALGQLQLHLQASLWGYFLISFLTLKTQNVYE